MSKHTSFAKQSRIERSPRGYVTIRMYPGGEHLATAYMNQATKKRLESCADTIGAVDAWNIEMQKLETQALYEAKAEFKRLNK